jgi:hypothetical protein
MYEPVETVVVEVHEDIKNGRPGICYGSNWAYLTQVVQVVEF